MQSTDNNMFCNFFDSPSANRTPCFFLENSLCARIATSLMRNLSVNKRGILDSPAADGAERGRRFRSGRRRRNCFVQFFFCSRRCCYRRRRRCRRRRCPRRRRRCLCHGVFLFYFSLLFYSPFFFFDGGCLCRESNLSFPANQK